MPLAITDWEKAELMPGFCMIQVTPSPDRQGSIILPDRAQVMQTHGVIVNAGQSRIPGAQLDIENGDHVIYSRWAGAQFDAANRQELTMMRHDDLLCVIEVD